MKALREEEAYLRVAFEEDIASYAIDCMEPYTISEKQADAIVTAAWAEGHSGGYSEVLNQASSICSFLHEFLDAAGK